MNEYSQQIKRELEGFQSAIQKLGTGIKAASSLKIQNILAYPQK